MKPSRFLYYLRCGGFMIACWILVPETLAQYYSASVYKDAPGMLSNRIYGLTQLPSGELWFITQEGINVYDGFEWKSFPDSIKFLPHQGHVSIKTAQDSSVYLLGINNGRFSLRKYKNGQVSELPLPDEFHLPGQAKFRLALSDDLHVFISYKGHLHEFDGSTWTRRKVDLFNDNLRIHEMKSAGDSLWLATSRGLILYYKQNFFPLVRDQEVYSFHYDPSSSTMYLLGPDWIGELKNEVFQKLQEGERIGLLNDVHHSFMYKYRNKLYYSLNSTLYSYDLETHSIQSILSDFFNSDYICTQAMFDRENNLWVATRRGAFKISNLNIYSYNKNQLIENEVSAILEASNGDIYLGSNSGFNILKQDGSFETYPFTRKYLQQRVMDIVEYDGVIYFAAHSAGVVRFQDGTLDYDLIEGEQTRASDLHVYDGRLLAAVNSSIYELTPSGWKLLTSAETLTGSQPIIRKIFWDAQYKYLMTPIGIYDCEREKYYVSPNLDETNVYTGIKYNGKVLLGTTAGIAEIVDEQITPSKTVKDPLKKPVYSFLLDSQKRLWVGTEQGIFHKEKYKILQHISKANGLIGNEINRNAFVQLKDERILVGTDEGLSIYTPEEGSGISAPSTELLKITANGNPIKHRTLTYDQNQLQFYFRGISFYNEAQINYRAKLMGFDKDWRYLPYHNQRSVLYTNIKPGSYRFLVQSRVGDSEWSQPVHSGLITIEPAFFDTTWFKMLLAASIILVVALIVRLRNKHLKSRNTSLEARISDKTKALHEQNLELMKTIRELKSTQGQLIQSEKLASMGHLTAGIAHEMNNPLNYIRGGAECLKQNLHEINELHTKMHTTENGEKEKYMQEYSYLIQESNQLLDSILNGAEKSTHIVKSLSSFTADAQNFYSFVDLEREVETALTLLNNQIGFRITINKFFGNVPRLECFPAKINQMLVNILLNATQAINGKGEITIRIYRKDIKHLALEITDTGEGLDLEDEEKVFEPFFTTKDNNPGLGLTIVKSIVQDHNGEIRFFSKAGRGTKLKIILPLQQTFHPELELDAEE